MLARKNKIDDFKCPKDGATIDLRQLKELQKDARIMDFTKKYETYLEGLAAERGLQSDDPVDLLAEAEQLRLARIQEKYKQ